MAGIRTPSESAQVMSHPPVRHVEMKILLVAGARPNFMKVAPILTLSRLAAEDLRAGRQADGAGRASV